MQGINVTFPQARSVRHLLLLGASAMAISTAFLSAPKAAQACSASGANQVVSTDCSGAFTWTGGNLEVTQGGTLSGAASTVNISQNNGTLTNSGLIIATEKGVMFHGGGSPYSVDAVINNRGGTIVSSGTSAIDVANGAVGAITNSGLLQAQRRTIDNETTIGVIHNTGTGTIVSTNNRGQAIANNGSITSIINEGTIESAGTLPNTDGAGGSALTGNPMGIANSRVINSIYNSGLISVSGFSSTGVYNGGASGTIGTLTNMGRINATGPGTSGIGNYANMPTIINGGIISATGVTGGSAVFGVFNRGTIGELNNTGVISASSNGATGAYAIRDRGAGTIGMLRNSGTIIATGTNSTAISLMGTVNGPVSQIFTVDNSGTIAGESYAIRLNNSATNLGRIVNSGVIAGNIDAGTANLTIAGGGFGQEGILTGFGPNRMGTIRAANVTFSSGSLVLNDHVNVGSGTLTNSGILTLNRTTNLTGNFTQTPNGVLVIGVTNANNYGSLAMARGSTVANLDNSNVSLVRYNNAQMSVGDRYTIVSSAASVTATGLNVMVPERFAKSISTTGGDLVVTLDAMPNYWKEKSKQADPESAPVGGALDSLANNPAFQTLLQNLSDLSPAQQNRGIQQLGVSQLTPQVNNSGAIVAPTTSAVQQRQVALLQGGDQTGVSAGSGPLNNALWGQFLGGRSTRDTGSNANGFNATSYGVMFGGDTQVDRNAIAGLAASWLRSSADGKAASTGNHTQVDSYQLTGYGTWRPNGGAAYTDGLLAVGYNQYDQHRDIDFLGARAQADYHGWQYQAKLGGGYDLPKMGGVTLTPLGSLQLVRVENQAYGETGAGLANLSVEKQGFNSLESELGARAAMDFDTSLGNVKTDLKVAWVHSYLDSPVATSAAMGGVSFVSTTERPAADGARINLGATLSQSDELSIRAEYDGELRPDYRSHTGLLRVRNQF